MVDRVASDHPSVTSVRATVARHGPRHRIELPSPVTEGLALERGTVRVVVDGRTRVARLGGSPDRLAVVGLFETHHAAEAGHVEFDELTEWLDANGRGVGSSVIIDVIDPGERLGLRTPGERVTYRLEGRPPGGLSDLAERYGD